MTFEQDRPASPADVGGDLKIATFNVLNYFTTLGVDYDAGPGSCSAFVDRDDNPIAVTRCSATARAVRANATANFERQQAKIVNAINTMDADIVSLEEIENSRKVDDGEPATRRSPRWSTRSTRTPARRAGTTSTRRATAAAVADEDVIRTGFIYNPSTVEPVGRRRS